METAVAAPGTEQIIGTIEAVLGTLQEEGAACADTTIKADDLGVLKGAVKGLIKQLQDETQARKKAEQTLQQTLERYQRLEATIPGMLYVFALHPEGTCSLPYVSPASREHFGYEPEEIMRNWDLVHNLVHPEDLARFDQSIRDSAETLQPWRELVRFIVKGETRWYDCMSRPRPPQPNGEIIWDGIVLDITERIEAQAKLQCTEPLLSTVLPTVQDSCMIIERDLTISYVNRTAEEQFRMRMPLVGRKCYEAFYDRNEPCDICTAKQALSTGSVSYSQTHYAGPAGKWYDVYYFPLQDPKTGQISRFLSYSRDITARKQAEESLKESETRFRNLIETMNEGLSTSDQDLRITFVNERFCRMLQYSRDELLGHHLTEFVREDFREVLNAQAAKRKKGEAQTYEIAWETKGGETLYTLVSPRGIFDEKGTYLGSLGILTDITERKRTEMALRESEERFRALFENANDVILLLDGDRYVECNARAVELNGYTNKEELLGQPPWHSSPPTQPDGSDSIQKAREYNEAAYRGNPQRFDWRILGKDGTPVDLEVSLNRLMLPDKNYLLVIGRDITERKKAELALRASEAKYRLLHESIRDAFATADMEGRILDCNSTYQALLGYTIEELQRLTYIDLTVEKWHAMEAKIMAEQVFPRGYSHVYEKEYRRKDGTVFPVEVRTFLIRDVDGKPAAMWAIVRDITERKRAEEELKATKQQLADIIEFLPDATFVVDGERKIIAWNKALEQLTGTKKEDLLGKGDYAYAVPFYNDNRPILIDSFFEADAGIKPNYAIFERNGKAVYGEGFVPHVHKGKGAFFWAAASPLLDTHGNMVGAIESLRDITKNKRAEEALKESEQRFRDLVELLPESVYEEDAEGKITFANRSALEQFGYTASELAKGLNAFDMILPQHRDIAKEKSRQILQGGITSLSEYTALRKDGSTFPAVFHSAPIVRDGKIVGIRGIAMNMTQQKHLEAQLVQAQKMECVGRLAGGVAHDFNNMLAVILGNAELLKSRLQDDDPATDYVQEIENAALRSKDITSQMLAFSRKQIIAPKPLNLNNAILAVGKTLSRLIGEDIKLRVHAGKDVWKIKADPSQIDQVLMNLAVNARDAMPHGGKLVIKTANAVLDETYCQQHPGATPGAYVMLRVSDNGTGMDEEVLSHLFEPFFTTKEAGKGTGLGLATVYGIVKQNDGFIDVLSAPGQGSTFEIFLPRLTEVGGKEEIVEKAAEGHETGTILLVEDNTMVRDTTTAMLETLGHKVLAVTTPEEALKLCQKESLQIDLLLTDVVLPEMSGKELKERIEATRPGLNTLFMSGYPADVIGQHGVLEPGTHFLQKPFKIDELREKVQEAMKKRAK